MRRTLRHAAILLALTLAWPGAGPDGTKPLPPPSDQFATYHDRGASLVDQGRFDEALDYLDAAVKMRPQSVLALYNRGRLHYLSGRYELALADYDAALAVSPSFGLLRMNRGITLSNLHRLDDALAIWTKRSVSTLLTPTDF